MNLIEIADIIQGYQHGCIGPKNKKFLMNQYSETKKKAKEKQCRTPG